MFLDGLTEQLINNKMKKIFILTWVYHGLIQEPEIFYNRNDAELRKKRIYINGFNSDYDEINIFEKDIHLPKGI